jgi:hypothetical protein
MELGEQRRSNDVLQKQLHELMESFTNYKAGNLREQLDTDFKDRKDIKKESHIKGDSNHDSHRSHSPNWGKTRKEETPASSDWESTGESSTSQSDTGWGLHRNRQRRKSRTLPRDDKRFEKPQSRRGDRNDSWNGKRRGSPSRDSHSAKRLPQKEEWLQKGRMGASQWKGTDQVRTYIRGKGISDTQNVIA